MSFQEVVDSNPHLAGTVGQLRSVLNTPTYSVNPDQAFDNLDRDPLIESLGTTRPDRPASRLEFLQAVSASGSPTGGDVAKFCRDPANQLRGPEVSHQLLGRIQRRQALINNVTGVTLGLSLTAAGSLIRAATSSAPRALARQKATFAGRELSKYIMWAYPPADPANPYQEIGSTRASAVDVLGLGYFAFDPAGQSEVLVRWVHQLSSAMARRPTAWDAGTCGTNVYWRPGGKTFTLTSGVPGVTEVVHLPVQGQHLVVAIEELS